MSFPGERRDFMIIFIAGRFKIINISTITYSLSLQIKAPWIKYWVYTEDSAYFVPRYFLHAIFTTTINRHLLLFTFKHIFLCVKLLLIITVKATMLILTYLWCLNTSCLCKLLQEMPFIRALTATIPNGFIFPLIRAR